MDIGSEIMRMDRIVRQARGQQPHAEQLLDGVPAWERVLTGLGDVGSLLRAGATEVAPAWPDIAGELYADRLRRSATTVQGWQETLAAADPGQTVTALAERIRTTVAAIEALVAEFNAVVGELAGVAPGPGAVAAVDGIGNRLRGIADRAQAELDQLDDAFADAARRLDTTVDGTPWDGPAATMAAGGAAGAADGGADGGAGIDGVAMDAAGADGAGGDPPGATGSAPAPAGEGRAPELAGLTAPVPAAGLPTVPAAPLPPVSPVAPLPIVGAGGPGRLTPAPISRPGRSGGSDRGIGAVGGVGRGGGIGALGGIGGRGAGPIGAHGGASIAKAGRTIAASAPLGGTEPPAPPATSPTAAATSTTSGTRGGAPIGSALGGGGAGTGARPAPGTADPRTGGLRDRPPRSVPGVPPELRGRSGPPTPGRRPESPLAGAGPEPLDDELWQVDQPPPALGRARE